MFKVWPRHLDAKFTNIRTSGAFLVSSEIRGGKVQFVRIQSEAGRDCIVENPWLYEKEEIQIMRNGRTVGIPARERLAFETEKDEVIILRPAGLS